MLRSGDWSTDTYTDIQPCVGFTAKMRELIQVRKNILEEAQGMGKQFGLIAQMMELFVLYQKEVSLYVDAGSLKLSEAIATDTETLWLNEKTPDDAMTMRAFLSYFFSIGTIA